MNETTKLNEMAKMKDKALVAIVHSQHAWKGGAWDIDPIGAEYSESEKASECGEFAIVYIEAGEFAAALDLIHQAVDCELKFGEAPAWRPARAAVEALIAMQDEFDCT